MDSILGNGVCDRMSYPLQPRRAGRPSFAAAAMAVAATALIPAPAGAERDVDPLEFFEGRTESTSTIKVLAKKPFQSRAFGRGEIKADGGLYLVQRVEEDGREPFYRSWRIRQVGPGRFAGTMSEAKGPVTVQEIGDRYRFRFKMKGGLSVEQWVTPLPGGQAARSTLTIRKLGVKVGSSEGMIRRIG